MLPPSDKPNKPGSILEQKRGPLAQHLVLQLLLGYLLPTFLKRKREKNHSNISQAISPPESQSNHGNTET